MTSGAVPNYAKRDRYARAHERLSLALDHGFYIEAAMICESIISDRLHSHLHWRVVTAQHLTLDELVARLAADKQFRNSPPRFSLEKSCTLAVLIAAMRLDFDDFGKEAYVKLPSRLDRWRDQRNKITHNVIYTVPTSKTYAEEFGQFMALAQACAEGWKAANGPPLQLGQTGAAAAWEGESWRLTSKGWIFG